MECFQPFTLLPLLTQELLRYWVLVVRLRYSKIPDFDAFKSEVKGLTPVDPEELSRSLHEIQADMGRSIEELAKRELSNITQVEIVRELLGGRRTVAELVEGLYGLKQGDPGYKSHYYHMHKELDRMGSKGLVSRRRFGRDKPYSLTQLAVAKLTMIENVKRSLVHRAIPKHDLILYSVVLGLGVSGAFLAIGSAASDAPLLVLAFVFMFAGGAAFCRFLEAILRVV